jgi:FMN-dependent oxidoreductase (nitrilotriacetate monooxygenase family)
MEVCRKLWGSWEDGALVMDRERPQFADPSKVHRIEHEGRFFRSRGPLNVVPSPQKGPAIMQAGTSPKGVEFAAKYADALFAIQPRVEDARNYFDQVKGAVESHGRNPNECKILFGAQPIIGASESEAAEKQAEHNELVPLEAGMAILSAHLDFDLAQLPPDADMTERSEPELHRMRTRFRKLNGDPMTVAEVAARHGQSVGLPQIVGTPKSVADQLEAYVDEVGGDGFMLSPIYCPGAIEEFVDLIVPELQRRGRCRTEYRGRTQRDLLHQFN